MLRSTVLAIAGLSAFMLAHAAPTGMVAVETLSFSPGADTTKTVQLPAKTQSVAFDVKGGELFCASIKLNYPDGSRSGLVSNRSLASGGHVMSSSSPGSTYSSAVASCHATGASATLVVSASDAR